MSCPLFPASKITIVVHRDPFLKLTSIAVWDEAILSGDRLGAVRGRIIQFNQAVGILRAVNQGDLARNPKRHNILEWLWPDSYWQRHYHFRKRRIADIGQWAVDKPRFKQWSSLGGTSSPNLICVGVCMFPKLFFDLFLSWFWKVIHYVIFLVAPH